MTMRVVFLKDHDGYKADQDLYIERTLGRRLCDNGVTIPYVTHMATLAKAKEEAETKAEKKAEKEAEEKAKAEKLLKEKEEAERETAESKPAKTRSKSIKK